MSNKPVAYVDERIHGWPDCFVMEPDPPHTVPLYAAPVSTQEPVAWTSLTEIDWARREPGRAGSFWAIPNDPTKEIALYAASRQWVGLTDEDIKIAWYDIDGNFARAIEAKLKEKNGG